MKSLKELEFLGILWLLAKESVEFDFDQTDNLCFIFGVKVEFIEGSWTWVLVSFMRTRFIHFEILVKSLIDVSGIDSSYSNQGVDKVPGGSIEMVSLSSHSLAPIVVSFAARISWRGTISEDSSGVNFVSNSGIEDVLSGVREKFENFFCRTSASLVIAKVPIVIVAMTSACEVVSTVHPNHLLYLLGNFGFV